MSVAEGVEAGRRVEVDVRALASNGAGVAELPDGRVVFVHRTAPGDHAKIVVRRVHRRWATGRLVEVLSAGPDRQAAPCPLYGSCGGCTLQHVGYPTQLAWKGRFVSDALARIGGLEAPTPEVRPSPLPWHYRNRVTFTVRRLRGGRVIAGFHDLERPERLVEVRDECLLPEAPLASAWVALRAAWGRGAERLPSPGDLRITLRTVDEGVVILVRGGASGWEPGDLLERVPGCRALWHRPAGGSDAMVAGQPARGTRGTDRARVEGGAFQQVNRRVAHELVRHVVALALEGAVEAGHAVDAYCGVGVYGRALAGAGWTVTGIEVDAEACDAARQEAPAGFDVLEGRVEESLASCLPAELVIVNPPRTGLDEHVTPILAAEPAPRVIYVSCDPATLARDAGRLRDTYALEDMHCFDLFPQTAHVETVALFTRRSNRVEGV